LLGDASTKKGYVVEEHGLTIGDMKSVYPEIRGLHFRCTASPEKACSGGDEAGQKSSGATVMNAFSILMSGEKIHIRKKNRY